MERNFACPYLQVTVVGADGKEDQILCLPFVQRKAYISQSINGKARHWRGIACRSMM